MVKWIDRKFDFGFPAEDSPHLLERLRKAPDQLDAIVSRLPRPLLVARDGDTWTIQENAGHLADTELLFLGRLDDYAAGCATLRPADMTNRRTFSARYNDRDIEAILTEFRSRRSELIQRLDQLEAGDFVKSAMHPRLQKQMRICDMMYFQAEHDAHHLERIQELAGQL